MSLQWFFPHDRPGDGVGTAERPVATVDVAAGLVDGLAGDAVRSPDWVVSGPGRVAVSSEEVSDGVRVIADREGDAVVVRVIGEVDLRNAGRLAAALRAGWESTRAPGCLVVDLTGVVFFSVTGLALLVVAEQQCRERQLELRVVATTRSVLRALRVTGLNVWFDVSSTLAEATRPRKVRSGLSGATVT